MDHGGEEDDRPEDHQRRPVARTVEPRVLAREPQPGEDGGHQHRGGEEPTRELCGRGGAGERSEWSTAGCEIECSDADHHDRRRGHHRHLRVARQQRRRCRLEGAVEDAQEGDQEPAQEECRRDPLGATPANEQEARADHQQADHGQRRHPVRVDGADLAGKLAEQPLIDAQVATHKVLAADHDAQRDDGQECPDRSPAGTCPKEQPQPKQDEGDGRVDLHRKEPGHE